jgi:hypothetical protein
MGFKHALAITLLSIVSGGTSYLSISSLSQAQVNVQSSVKPDSRASFSCRDSEAIIQSKGGAVVEVGGSRIYAGYQQVSSDNQDPIVTRFDNGRQVWCRTNYETSGDDGRGYGLMWDGGQMMYAVFSATGTQGEPNKDYRRFTQRGWLPTYGAGGGAKVAVIAKINPQNGAPLRGSFLTAILENGKSNSLEVTQLSWHNRRLLVQANSWYSPRRIDRKPMTCSGASPFPYTLKFSPDLSRIFLPKADRCS